MIKEWLIGKSTLLWLLVAQFGLVFIALLASRYLEVAGLYMDNHVLTTIYYVLFDFWMFEL
jgi:hypothetical protein